MGMHEIEEMEQRYLTPEQLEAKYGSGRKAKIMPDAKATKLRPSTSSGRTGQFVQSSPKPAKPGAKSKQTA